MKHQVKICGLTQEEDVTKAIEFGAGYLGFIIEAKSPRKLTIGQAVSLFKASKGKAKRVAVTVNPDDRLLECVNIQVSLTSFSSTLSLPKAQTFEGVMALLSIGP